MQAGCRSQLRNCLSLGVLNASRRAFYQWLLIAAEIVVVSGLIAPSALADTTATTTTLSLSSSSEVSGTVVSFTASVSNGSPVTVGQVDFCDASANDCEDSALIGMAQLTSAGTAIIKLAPSVGNHSYKAVFKGTAANTQSASSAQSLAVSGKTTITISASGSPGNYSLTGTVAAEGTTQSPTGTVTFVDTTDNYGVGSANLGSATLEQKLGPDLPYQAGVATRSVTA